MNAPLDQRDHGMAYHVVVHALEGQAGWTPTTRFASTVTHAIAGHVPHRRYREAGRVRKREGMSTGEIERAVAEWLAADLNPAIHFMRGIGKAATALAFYNAYNQSAQLAVRTQAAHALQGEGGSRLVVSRKLGGSFEDLEPCQLGTIAVLNAQMAAARTHEATGRVPAPQSLSTIALMLGAGSTAAADVALVFETEGAIAVKELASRLGCHQRTLERRLRQEGLTAEAIRQAQRMIAATNRLRSRDSLTEIAFEQGFSDLAHMTRAFRASCGMPPSLLKRLAMMDVA